MQLVASLLRMDRSPARPVFASFASLAHIKKIFVGPETYALPKSRINKNASGETVHAPMVTIDFVFPMTRTARKLAWA